MAARSTKSEGNGESRANRGGEDLHQFLVRDLPPEKTRQVPYLMNALQEAGARYDRYIARREDWIRYGPRGNRLKRITKLAEELATSLGELDILSRDDLASCVDPRDIETLVGSLYLLSKESRKLANEVQESGRPSDLAEVRWILELADIYENAFGQPARVWGSGDGPIERRGKFYRLLELSRPTSFARYGKLSVRQIGRTLGRRNAKIGRIGTAVLLPEPAEGAEPE